ncbi:MAG: prolyl oligopeptidase family serine peptidase [Planctomycetaceae bacterium]|jgi:predicted esterase|nr:prolyl oligopeptidase family serine peptidase [Planctomycetaceae bacterium]
MKKILLTGACVLFLTAVSVNARLTAFESDVKEEKTESVSSATTQEITQDQLEAIAIQPASAFKATKNIPPAMLSLFKEETLNYTGKKKYRDTPLKYRLYVPENFEPNTKYPLILWLHGAGENGDDNELQLVHLHHNITYFTGKKKRDFFLLVPQAPKPNGWYLSDYSGTQTISKTGFGSYGSRTTVRNNSLLGQIANALTKKKQSEKKLWQNGNSWLDETNELHVSRTVRLEQNGTTITKTVEIEKIPYTIEVLSNNSRRINTNRNDPNKVKEEPVITEYENADWDKTLLEVQKEELITNMKRSYSFLGEDTEIGITVTYDEKTENFTVKISTDSFIEDSPFGYSFAMVDEVVKKYPVDTNRITVSGLSSGGDGTWRALEMRPDLFAAAVPLVSWRALQPEEIEKSPVLKKIPIWAIYSSDDSGIDHARESFEQAESLGCNVKKSEFGVCGHNAWTPAMLQGDIFSWLLSRAKKDGEYVQVLDVNVNPDDMKGIVEAATRDNRQPTLAPARSKPQADKPVSSEEDEEENTVEIETADGKVQGKIIEECERPWAMTSDSQYGLFAADWMREAKELPRFVVELSSDELSNRLAKSVSGDGKDIAEVCRSVINGENKPMSNPLFETHGGRLRDEIEYSLSDKGKMLVRLLKTVKDSQIDLADLAKKALEKIDLIAKK